MAPRTECRTPKHGHKCSKHKRVRLYAGYGPVCLHVVERYRQQERVNVWEQRAANEFCSMSECQLVCSALTTNLVTYPWTSCSELLLKKHVVHLHHKRCIPSLPHPVLVLLFMLVTVTSAPNQTEGCWYDRVIIKCQRTLSTKRTLGKKCLLTQDFLESWGEVCRIDRPLTPDGEHPVNLLDNLFVPKQGRLVWQHVRKWLHELLDAFPATVLKHVIGQVQHCESVAWFGCGNQKKYVLSASFPFRVHGARHHLS